MAAEKRHSDTRGCEASSGTRAADTCAWNGNDAGVAQIRISADDGSKMTQVFDARMPLQFVVDRIAERRAAGASPFALRLSSSGRQLATAEELQLSIRDAGLEPRGEISVALIEASRPSPLDGLY